MKHSWYSIFLDRVQHSQPLQVIDSEIMISSTRVELVEFVLGELLPLLPKKLPDNDHNFTCVIEYSHTANVLFPDVFDDFKESDGKDISSAELGDAVLYCLNTELLIIQKDVGSFYHDSQGNFLILVDSDTLIFSEGKRLNIQGLLNLMISEVLLLTGKLLVHAGGVGDGEHCFLWTGQSGSGKTTQTLSMVSKGFDFYGDDQIIVGQGKDKMWYAWPFWRAIKVSRDSLQNFDDPRLLSKDVPEVGGKVVINDIERALKTQKPGCGKIAAINLIVAKETGILEELNLTTAFERISPCFLHAFQPTTLMHTMEELMDLLSAVPVRAVSWDMLDNVVGDG